MKRCPECRRDYYDDSLLYCLDDGTGLLEGPASVDSARTAILPAPYDAASGASAEAATRAFDPSAVQRPGTENSIVVLPFANISNDSENEYFCDGLAEELMNALANINGLKVAARTSSFAFKGRKAEISDIARALNVRTILDGSVRRSGDQLRITVQLINAADGYHLWSERYDREMRDVFVIQDEITQAVVDTLKVKLRVKMGPTQKPEDLHAYELYLKGKYHLAKLTPPDLQTSIQYFSQATEVDPSYARAFVALADAYLRLSIAAELPSGQFFPKSKAAAQKAIELDPESCEVYVVLAWIAFWYDWDWLESERLVRRALEIDPNSTDAHTAFAHLLSNSGRHSEALTEIARARELDPLSLFAGAMEGQFLLHAGETAPALTVLLKVIELEPNFWLPHLFAASVYIEKQMPNEAFDEAKLARQLSRGSTQAAAFEAFSLALAGRRPEAVALVDEIESSKERYLPPYHAALLQKALGNTNAALTQLERGIDERDVKMVFLNVEPKWNDLRDHTRFRALLERVGFSPDAGGGSTSAL